MAGKERLDKLMLARGLAPSREKAQALIMAGQALVNDRVVDKAGQQVAIDAEIRIRGEQLPYVSRGGLKLKKALDQFGIEVNGLVALDVGASTGGFTDCLLQAGAARVFAVDVGYGQLAWKLQQDPRVVSMERVNIRYLTPEQLGGEPELAVIDASFISLSKVLPSTVLLLKPGSRIIALIKPQFEVGRGEVGKGGIVRDPTAHEKAVDGVRQAARNLGLTVSGLCDSPITGADGNREFLILLEMPEHAVKEADVENCIFCKIIRGEIPSKKVFEDEQLLVVEDVTPKAPLHLLLIPKRHFVNCLDMTFQDDTLVGSLFRKAAEIAREKGYEASGFRVVQNNGAGAGQSVFHIHFHLLAGRAFAWPPG
ncbi:MAG: TlyA family rRNA (cytidine-2'-O)-methyltransferase [Desulfuromonadales bacterium]|nr:TlyA family rRNA (cytidine-2'-O)-methyltransferase [Desulfuromonadales bacterium]